jgi:prepilin-type N-terminal cleavage/methylation domain-containing protein
MEQLAWPDEKGLTLVEVMIALLIMLLVSLALMETALLSIGSNMRNIIRDEAVSIAEMRMNEARNISFDNLVDDTADAVPDDNLVLDACRNSPVSDPLPYPVKINRNFRNIANFEFGTRRTVAAIGSDNRQITVLVRWVYRNECYTHSVSTIMRRQ